jgi:hypothetical protein
MEDKKCIKCNQTINPLRIKALPNTKTCVDCSTVGAKKGVSMMYGEKDNTWNDMIIIEPEEIVIFNNEEAYLEEFEDEEKKIENKNEDEDEEIKLWDNTLLDGLEDL